MKKLIATALAAITLSACNDANTSNAAADRDTTAGGNTSAGTMDTTRTVTTTTTTDNAYAPAEGDVTYREKKVKVRRNGEWVETKEDVRLDNGVVVYRSGKVRKDDKERELKEGEVVDKTGNFFDKTGRAIENAWDKTKEGVKDAGKAVGNAAEKVGKKAKDAVDKDEKKQ